MKRKFLLMSLVLLQVCLVMAQQSGPPGSTVPGTVRVKLTPAAAVKVKAMSGTGGVIEKSGAAPFSTGLSTFDAVCSRLKTTRLKRVFRDNPKFRARHQEAGLDLWYELKIDESVPASAAVRSLSADENVVIAEPIHIPILYADEPVNDPFLNQQWHYHNTGQTGGRIGADINLFEAWKRTMGSKDVIVAIIDGGIELTHPDLKNNLWINEAELNGKPGVDNDGNGYAGDIYGWNFVNDNATIKGHFHGTHVAGTIGAENNNGIGVSGIAGGNGNGTGVRLMSCQVFSDIGGLSDFAESFIYAADNGAVIAQCSWGYKSPGIKNQAELDAIDYFIKNAGKDNRGNPLPGTKMKGGIVFFAAGNENADGDFWPGCYENVYAVAATNQYNQRASYSNYGEWVDIAAPGGEGEGIQSVISTYIGKSYAGMPGTSMACPHISGVAALVLSLHGGPEYTPDMLWNKLKTSCEDLDELNPEYAGMLGVGIINASKAVQLDEGVPPQAITNLSVSAKAHSFVELSFTAPADSDNGSAFTYELRYSDKPIDPASFDKLPGVFADAKEAGTAETLRLPGLTLNTTYYVAVKSRDIWGNLSSLSNIVEVKTTGYPQISVPGDLLSLNFPDVNANPTASVNLNIKNLAEGALKYSLFYTGGEDPRTIPANPIDQIMNYTIPEYDILGELGDDGLSDPFFAATSFDVTNESFNLSGLKVAFKTENVLSEEAKENFNLKIYKGGKDIPNEGELVFSYDGVEIKNLYMQEIYIRLSERILFKKGDRFWVVFEFPAQYKYPMGINTEVSELKNPCLMSSDRGKTWSDVNEAGFDLPPIVAYRIFPQSEIEELPEYLTFTPQTGYIYGSSSENITITGNAKDLVNGDYISYVKIQTDDPVHPLVTVPVKLTVAGHAPIFNSPEDVEFGITIVGKTATRDIPIFNSGKGTLVIDKIYASDPAFSVSPDKLSVLPGEDALVRVTYSPLVSGPVSAALKFDANTNLESVAVAGTGTNPPIASANPSSISLSLAPGESRTAEFSLKNTGTYQLEYSIPGLESANVFSITDQTTGYRAVTSRDMNGPKFRWENMDQAVDVTQEVLADPAEGTVLDLGFEMNYYGYTYNNVSVLSTGILSMGPIKHHVNVSVDFPMSQGPGNLFAPLFNIKSLLLVGGKVLYKKASGYTVIEYKHVGIAESSSWFGKLPGSGTVDVQVVLHHNGIIEFYYNNFEESEDNLKLMSEIVAGFENIDGTDGANISLWDENFLVPGEQLAVRILPPTPNFVKTISPASGIITPGEEVKLKVELESSLGALDSTYINHIFINTNDPVVETIDMPLTIRVNAVSTPMAILDTLDFGEIGLGYAKSANISVFNQGGKRFTITSVKADTDAFSVSSPEGNAGIVNPFSSLAYSVTFNPGNVQEYSGTLTFTSDVAGAQPIKVVVKGKGIQPSKLEFEGIRSQDYTLRSGEKADTAFIIKNAGAGNLEYLIQHNDWIKVKDQQGPALYDGRDRSGYYWTDSHTNSGVTFDWISIENATMLEDVETTLGAGQYVLPFEFPYYGKNYTKLVVSAHGRLGFNTDEMDELRLSAPFVLPKQDQVNNLIAGLAVAYYPGSSLDNNLVRARIFAENFDDKVVFTWNEMLSGNFISWQNGTTVTFQMILYKDGRIKFQYKDVENALWAVQNAIIGIENADGTDGLCVDYMNSYVKNESAVMITPGKKYSLAPGASARIPLEVNASGIYDGEYVGKLVVSAADYTGITDSIRFGLKVLGTPEFVLSNDTADFGNLFVYQEEEAFKSYTYPISVSNTGTKAAELTSVTLPQGFELNDLGLPMVIEPGTKAEGTLVFTPKTEGTYKDNVVFTYGGDLSGNSGEMHVTAGLLLPPVANLASDFSNNIYSVTLMPDQTDVTELRMENKGKSDLTYQLNIEYLDKNVFEELTGTGSQKAKAGSIKRPESIAEKIHFVSVDPEEKTVFDAASSDYDFADSLSYQKYNLSSQMLQLNASVLFSAATRFDVPEGGFNLTHVGNQFKNVSNNIPIQVSVFAGKDLFSAEEIHSQLFISKANSDFTLGKMEVVELNRSYYFQPGESFWIVFTHESVDIMQGLIFYDMGEQLDDYFCVRVEDEMGYNVDFNIYEGFMMAAYSDEKKDGKSGWITLNPGSGTIQPEAVRNTEVLLNPSNIFNKVNSNYVRISVDSNDPIERKNDFYLHMGVNQGPYIYMSRPLYSMNEGGRLEIDVMTEDRENDSYELKLKEVAGQPKATLSLVSPGMYKLVLTPDYHAAGNWEYTLIGEDTHGFKTEKSFYVSVRDINRAPERKGNPNITIYTGDAPKNISLSDYIVDPDGDLLIYELEDYDVSLLAVQLNGSNLRLVGWHDGKADVVISASDPYGASFTDTLHVTVQSTTGISSGTHNSAIKVYPNPVKDLVNIDLNFNGKDKVRIEIVDLSGILHYSEMHEAAESVRLDLISLPSGVYQLVVRGTGKQEVIKLIKD